MLALLGCFTFVAIGIAAASLGFGVYTYYDSKGRAEDMQAKQEAQITKNKRRAKSDGVWQYNLALSNMWTGEVLARRDEIMATRRQNYEDEHYGSPVVNDEEFWADFG